MRRPNILLIHTDHQRFDALAAAGNREIQTPHLDRLAADGARLTHYFVQSSVCMPSRMSYLTGMYPADLGVLGNGPALPDDAIPLPAMLRNYGYRSANIGKLHFLPHAARNHREIHPSFGFDDLEISDEPGCYEDAYRQWVRRLAPDQLDGISLGLPPAARQAHPLMGLHEDIRHPELRNDCNVGPFQARENLTHTAFVGRQTCQWLRTFGPREPFLCVAGFYAPHSPWIVPQRYLDLYDPQALSAPPFPPELSSRTAPYDDETIRRAKQGFYAAVTEVDYYVGQMLDTLEELDLARQTIVVFTSDHGEWLGEHLKYGKGYPAHDCISRVPMLIRWPEGLSGGQVIDDIVEGVDVAPTLLELCGIPRPPHLAGRRMIRSGRRGAARARTLKSGSRP